VRGVAIFLPARQKYGRPGLDKYRDSSYIKVVSLAVELMQYPFRDGLPNDQNRPDASRATALPDIFLNPQTLLSLNLQAAFFLSDDLFIAGLG
jgi:hypothetical protein